MSEIHRRNRISALMKQCQQAKEVISNGQEYVDIEVEYAREDDDDCSFYTHFTHRLLNMLLKPKLMETKMILLQTLREAKKEVSGVDKVMMVGGSSHLQQVSGILSEMFGEERMVDMKQFHPMDCVSRGALLKGMWVIRKKKCQQQQQSQQEQQQQLVIEDVDASGGVVVVVDESDPLYHDEKKGEHKLMDDDDDDDDKEEEDDDDENDNDNTGERFSLSLSHIHTLSFFFI